jgi:osmotically-inducible protein OsmY
MLDLLQEAIARDPYLSSLEIRSLVVDGEARLYGEVDSWLDKQRAELIAARVKGITEVENRIRVRDEGPFIHSQFYDPHVDEWYVEEGLPAQYERRRPAMSDSTIEQRIESEMWWSPFVAAQDIDVTVEDGVATLTGSVESWAERRSATENAYEGGATLVENNTVIRED